MRAKFEVFEGIGGWYFHLTASNGQIIAQSEGYTRRGGALKGVRAVKKCAAKAKVEIEK